MAGIKLNVTNLKDLVTLAEELNIDMEGLNQEQLIEAVERAMFGGAIASQNNNGNSKILPRSQAAAVDADDLTPEQHMVITAVLNTEDIKADKIRTLLQAGIPKGKIAKLLNVRYQQVYQVEQRMMDEQRDK